MVRTEQEKLINQHKTVKEWAKPTYSPSRMAYYARCPRMFRLSRDYEKQIGASTSAVQREGSLFEGYVFGFNSTDPDKTEKKLIGRKKETRVNKIKGHADFVRPIFQGEPQLVGRASSFVSAARRAITAGKAKHFVTEGSTDGQFDIYEKPKLTGQAFKFMSYDAGNYIIRGEADYFGLVNPTAAANLVLDLSVEDTIGNRPLYVDLKYTGDISRTWDFNSVKEDYLQSVFYPYLHYKQTGEIVNFMYVVVESQYKYPVVRFIFVEVDSAAFDYVEELVEKVNRDMFFRPQADKLTCLGGMGQARCWFLDYCQFGRAVLGGVKNLKFSELNSAFGKIKTWSNEGN